MKIKIRNLQKNEAYKTLEDYLLYKKSENDIIARGTQIILSKSEKEKSGQTIEIFGKTVISQYTKIKTENIYKAYMEERPIAGGSEILIKKDKIYIYENENENEELQELKMPENLIHEVMTEKEICEKYDISEKQMKKDTEALFTQKNTYKNITLLTKKEIMTIYNKENNKEKTEKDEINPLLFVLTTQEAAYIWNRKVGEVRAAASGAGHRAARLKEGVDTRKSGNTWIITTEAAKRLFGQADPVKMKAFYKKISNRKNAMKC